MSTFTALNIEPDTDVEEEVDNTAEIQVEEALKLFQNALKLHSQGPAFYKEAEAAYDALLKSEIFNYPGSTSENRRAQQQGFQGFVDDNGELLDEVADEFVGDETVTYALPRTVYLSYKNLGQFLLDKLKLTLAKARRQLQEVETLDEHAINESALSAIDCFGKALERDDTDLNLWRKTARLGTTLKSWRTARFCLESIIDGDDELQDEVAERMGLERALAIRGLQQILSSTEDDVCASIQQLKKPRKALLRLLEHQADPLPFLSCPSFPRLAENPDQSSVGYTSLLPDKITWTALGQAILNCLRLSRDGQVNSVHGSVRITFPEPIDLLCSDLPASLKLAVNANDNPSNQPEAETCSKMGAESEKATSGGNLPVLGSATKGNEASPSESGEQQTRQNESEARKSGESRKRSSIAAGNEEQGDNGRAKSKRLRARENITELAETEHSVFDQAQAQEEWMLDYYHADVNFFRVVDVFLKQLGFGSMERPEELRKIWKEYSQSDPSDDSLSPQEKLEATLFKTLRSALYGWDDKKAKLSLDSLGNSNSKNPDEAKRTAMSMLLAQFAKDQKRPDSDPLSETLGLTEFVQKINDQDLDIETVAYRWVTALLDGGLSSSDIGVEDKSSYATKLWTPEMKQVVLSLIAESHDIFYSELNEFSSRVDGFVSGFDNGMSPEELKSQLQSAITISQSIFELSLESYFTLLKSDAEAGPSSAPLQRSLTERWCRLSRYFINLYTVLPDTQPPTTVALRHLWAFTLYLNLPHQTESEHILRSLCELERVLVSEGRPVIILPNNAAMPEISVQIIEQEKSRLMSIDFFTNLFRPDNSDPAQVIENLAPLLEPESIKFVNNDSNEETTRDNEDADLTSKFEEMASFLDPRNATLRLYLWKKLREAYDAIDYFPKVVDCYLRMIEIVTSDLYDQSCVLHDSDESRTFLMKSLNTLYALLTNFTERIRDEPENMFENLDNARLQVSISVFLKIGRFLQAFAYTEDAIRVGYWSAPDVRAAARARALEQFREKLRSMIVISWTLLYLLFREGIIQNKEAFNEPDCDRISYLRSMHNALGLRYYCKYADKLFLRLMKKELQSLPPQPDYEFEVAQVFFDLYGLKFGAGLDVIVDHRCPLETMDPPTAISIVDFIMMHARRINIKDLHRSELKAAIDTVQLSIGPPSKACHSLTLNRRVLAAYFKSPIDQTCIFRCFQGIGEVSTCPVRTATTKLAENGWYFLLGQCTLTKFRSQKRLTPAPTDDLDSAILNFRRVLEHGHGDWETWYHLAQAYDMKLAEDLSWSSDKINDQTDLVAFQRTAIHCYTMAVAFASRTPDLSPKTCKAVSDLYTDFGLRLYASSREPLSMEVFSLANFERHFSSSSFTMYTTRPFREMRLYSVWELAAYLFQEAMPAQPKKWIINYMYTKCLWKMFSCDETTREYHKRVDASAVLDAAVETIQALPRKRDSRCDPILEPHYKLMSIVHKLVSRGSLTPSEGYERLQATAYAHKVPAPEGAGSWKAYILNVLKRVRNADKSNWHHRIPVRTAHILYDYSKDLDAASLAKAELTQHIFTKSMTLQVWRPEHERAGRHFVYTTRYVYFFVELLEQLNDRLNLELIAKRVRKKPSDFVGHASLWDYICQKYVAVVRRTADIPADQEETIFSSLTPENFQSLMPKVDKWCFKNFDHPYMFALRDSFEFKKLNGGLTKPVIFEDIIIDIYGAIFRNVTSIIDEEGNRADLSLLWYDGPTHEQQLSSTNEPGIPGMPAIKPRPVKSVGRKLLLRAAEALLTAASRPSRAEAEDQSLVPMLEVAIPLRPALGSMQDAQQEAATEDNSTAASVQGIGDDDSELSELEKSPEPPGSEPSLSDVEEQTTPTQGGTFIYRPIASADRDDDLDQGHGERLSPTPVEARVEDVHPSSDTDML